MNSSPDNDLNLFAATRIKKGAIALFLLLFATTLFSGKTHADTLIVAVASNFAETLESIVEGFEQAQPHNVTLVRGSSGRHYAQIVNGAPFDLFFSADSARAQQLVSDRLITADKVVVYAIGQLALWAPASKSAMEIELQLQDTSFERLSMANPKLAPYGQAAIEVLENLGLEQIIKNQQIVTGGNVAQAYQFIATGNAELGFVALSQLVQQPASQVWRVPQALYEPITQEMAVIKESIASKAFLDYLAGSEAQAIILQYGYKLPFDN